MALEITDQNFDEVLKSKSIVLVDFLLIYLVCAM
jgi:hypothetical protein